MSNRKLLILALSLILCLTVGLTSAYFTDYEDAKGGAILRLSGHTETEEHFDGNDKVVAIKNTGEVDMIVRVLAFGENLQLNSEDNSDWQVGEDGAVYYTKVLPAGQTTSEMKIKVEGRVDPDDPIDFDIVVVHEASRAVYEQDDKGNNVVVVPDDWTGCNGISEA